MLTKNIFSTHIETKAGLTHFTVFWIFLHISWTLKISGCFVLDISCSTSLFYYLVFVHFQETFFNAGIFVLLKDFTGVALSRLILVFIYSVAF